ncbi:MAG: acetoacetate decarboxylase family protein [Chloroflexi bacterium]|nr:acetoacetate decarboxylase family protein [Chloroflexota bacterium]
MRPGSGTPLTDRGRSIAYGPPPWRMRGRALAVQYRLADPDEARRHVPPGALAEDDPTVRARFWDLEHDAIGHLEGAETPWVSFREAVIAFPVSMHGVTGDYPTYMYADDFVYTAMGREVMGWPVRDGVISVDPEPATGLAAGTRMGARLARGGRELMRMDLELTGGHADPDDQVPPRWLACKVVPDVTGPTAAIAQVVATGPETIHHRRVWDARVTITVGEGPGDETHFLAPREIVRAEYWSELDLTIGWGTVLQDLGRDPW